LRFTSYLPATRRLTKDPATGISPRPQQLGEVVEPLSDPPGDGAAVFTLETRSRTVDKAVSR